MVTLTWLVQSTFARQLQTHRGGTLKNCYGYANDKRYNTSYKALGDQYPRSVTEWSFFRHLTINIRCTHEVCKQTYSWGASAISS